MKHQLLVPPARGLDNIHLRSDRKLFPEGADLQGTQKIFERADWSSTRHVKDNGNSVLGTSCA